MNSYENVKNVFEKSFENMPFEKISTERYHGLRKNHFPNFMKSPEELSVSHFSSEYTEVVSESEVFFAIKYSAYVGDIGDEKNIQQISAVVEDFIEVRNYKKIAFYLSCEKESGDVFSGIVFVYAQL